MRPAFGDSLRYLLGDIYGLVRCCFNASPDILAASQIVSEPVLASPHSHQYPTWQMVTAACLAAVADGRSTPR